MKANQAPSFDRGALEHNPRSAGKPDGLHSGDKPYRALAMAPVTTAIEDYRELCRRGIIQNGEVVENVASKLPCGYFEKLSEITELLYFLRENAGAYLRLLNSRLTGKDIEVHVLNKEDRR